MEIIKVCFRGSFYVQITAQTGVEDNNNQKVFSGEGSYEILGVERLPNRQISDLTKRL